MFDMLAALTLSEALAYLSRVVLMGRCALLHN